MIMVTSIMNYATVLYLIVTVSFITFALVILSLCVLFTTIEHTYRVIIMSLRRVGDDVPH